MNCKYCNADNSDNAKFCQQCGQSFMDITAPQTKTSLRPTGKTLKIGVILAVVAVILAIAFGINMFSNSPANKIRGTWIRDNTDLGTEEQITYTFTSKGGTNSKGPETQNYTEAAAFDWYVTDDNDLIILWSSTSCTKYIWNPDYNNYNLSPNDYSWYIKGNNLYLSSPSSQTGYYIYSK